MKIKIKPPNSKEGSINKNEMIPKYEETEFPNLSEENKENLKKWVKKIKEILNSTEILEGYYFYTHNRLMPILKEVIIDNVLISYDESECGDDKIIRGVIFDVDIIFDKNYSTTLTLEFCYTKDDVYPALSSNDAGEMWQTLLSRMKDIKNISFKENEIEVMPWSSALELITNLSKIKVPRLE